MEGQPNEATRPQMTAVYYRTPGPSGTEIAQNQKASHTVQKHLIVLSYDAQKIEHAAFPSSSVEIDVNDPSRVVRSEQLLEFLLHQGHC